MRRTVEYLNRFGDALHVGKLPESRCWRALGPDYEAQQAVITIFPDDAEFRRAVAETMPEGSYRIVVKDIRGLAP
jgi:hypothetical protein